MNTRTGSAAILAFAMLVTVQTAARADVSSDVTNQLKAAYQNQCKLLANQDFDGYAKTLTDDYYTNDASGTKVPKADAISQTKMTVARTSMKTGACTVEFTSSTQAGSDVTVNALVAQNADATLQGKRMSIVISTRELDTWTIQGNAWIQKVSVIKGQVIKSGDKVVSEEGSLEP